MMCHSIADVKSSMGQGDFYLEYPKLHELAATKNPLARALHDFLVKLNPEPHRRVFLKPFMRNQTAEFCSSCHKVHLDVPVNHYRWIRGFNEYDNWQASGVSGQGARSFYYPAKPSQCADCHMPLTRSSDMGNIDGRVHSHRFPAANTALPTANDDAEQLKITEDFLKSGILSVDIFALSPARAQLKREQPTSRTCLRLSRSAKKRRRKLLQRVRHEVLPVTAPLNRVQPAVRRGDTVRVDVVVRTKKIGHFFPGGTVDAYDTWLELKGTDDKGQTIFWSGMRRGQRQRPGGERRTFLPLAASGCARQSHQQAQCMGHAGRGVCASDSAGRGRHGSLTACTFPKAPAIKSRCTPASAIASLRGGTRSFRSPVFLIRTSQRRCHT